MLIVQQVSVTMPTMRAVTSCLPFFFSFKSNILRQKLNTCKERNGNLEFDEKLISCSKLSCTSAIFTHERLSAAIIFLFLSLRSELWQNQNTAIPQFAIGLHRRTYLVNRAASAIATPFTCNWQITPNTSKQQRKMWPRKIFR